MTEGLAHLRETHIRAGIDARYPSKRPRIRGWAWRYGASPANGQRVKVRYALLSAVDGGRVLAQRWDYQNSRGDSFPAMGAIALFVRKDSFDRIEVVK